VNAIEVVVNANAVARSLEALRSRELGGGGESGAIKGGADEVEKRNHGNCEVRG